MREIGGDREREREREKAGGLEGENQIKRIYVRVQT